MSLTLTEADQCSKFFVCQGALRKHVQELLPFPGRGRWLPGPARGRGCARSPARAGAQVHRQAKIHVQPALPRTERLMGLIKGVKAQTAGTDASRAAAERRTVFLYLQRAR